MRIKAKFAGRCGACGASIRVGDSIEWTRGEPSKHVVCSKGTSKSASSGSSVRPAPSFTEAEAPVTVCERRGRSKPEPDDRVGESFRLSRRDGQYPGRVVTVLGQRRSFLSEEDAEDIASIDDAGWIVTLYCRFATPEEEAAVVLREEEKEAAAWAQALAVVAEREKKEAEEAAVRARVDAVISGLVAAGECFRLDLSATSREVLGEIHGRVDVVWYRHTLPSGDPVVVQYTSQYDDERVQLFGPREVVRTAWRSFAASAGVTPEKAREWLSRYRGCSGTQAYEFIAGDECRSDTAEA